MHKLRQKASPPSDEREKIEREIAVWQEVNV